MTKAETITKTEIPEGVRTWGPFEDYELVTTPEGVFGCPPRTVMWLERRMTYDPKVGHDVEMWRAAYHQVAPFDGPLHPSKIRPPADRTPYLGNIDTDKLAAALNRIADKLEEE